MLGPAHRAGNGGRTIPGHDSTTALRVGVALTIAALWLAGSALRGADSPGADAASLTERVERLERELAGAGREARIDRGARLYARSCAACHGRNGRGDGPAARDLDPAPRNLGERRIRLRTTASGHAPRPEDLERTIRNGLPGTAMPAFRDLFSEREIGDLIDYIYSLRPDTSGGAELPAAMAIPAVGAADDASLDQGRSLYLMLGCWRCHGIGGAGDGPSAATLTDDEERPIRSTDLRYDPYKGGREAGDVVRTLLTGLNGSPMPAYGEALLIASDDAAADLPADDRMEEGDRPAIERFLQGSPSRRALEAMSDEERLVLRDRRLAALAHYVLSLDRRRGARYWLFRAEPEREGRTP